MKSYNSEKRKEQLERNIADFNRILKQENLSLDLAVEMCEVIKGWKKELRSINKLLKKNEI